MAEKWVTVKEAAGIAGRSQHTIYNWVTRTRRGVSNPALKIKRSDRENGRGWLIEVKSLRKVNKTSPRASRPRLGHRPVEAAKKEQPKKEEPKRPDPTTKFSGARSCFQGGDSMERVVADRRKWIKIWVDEGKSLGKIAAVFAPQLHQEIEKLYWDEIRSRWSNNGT